MPRKPPRRTRERILETALALFNVSGEPHVTTADIADEMNISPGNLYYHFRNKDDIIGELYARFDAAVAPLLAGPSARAADVEDLWLFVHVLFERMWEFRFFYRDLDEITSRNTALAARFAVLMRRKQSAVIELCEGLRAVNAMAANDAEIASLATNAVIVTTYWMSYRRLGHGTGSGGSSSDAVPDMRFAHGASQVLALVVPYLVGAHRVLAQRLRERYLDNEHAG